MPKITTTKLAFFLTFTSLFLAGCASNNNMQANVLGQQEGKYALVKAEEVVGSLASGVVVLDVRTPAEFGAECLEGAQNIDVQSGDFDAKIAGLDKTKKYLVYCRSGKRSITAVSKLKAAGFTDLLELQGGINAWKEAKEPVKAGCK